MSNEDEARIARKYGEESGASPECTPEQEADRA